MKRHISCCLTDSQKYLLTLCTFLFHFLLSLKLCCIINQVSWCLFGNTYQQPALGKISYHFFLVINCYYFILTRVKYSAYYFYAKKSFLQPGNFGFLVYTRQILCSEVESVCVCVRVHVSAKQIHGRKTIGNLAGLCSKKKPAPSANCIEYFFVINASLSETK